MGGWSVDDIPGQTGRLALVTGANSGLGLVTARELSRAGARVVLACRSVDRGEQAADAIRREVPGAALEVARLDLADLSSVREMAGGLAGRESRLDLLINNAGVMATPLRRTADGFELQFGTNHLGHFALTGLLAPRLLAAEAPRVVTVSSTAHRTGRIDFDDLDSQRGYSRWAAYGRSKLANLVFAYELQRRAEAAGSALRSLGAHPGYSATNLQASGPTVGGSLGGRLQAGLMAVTNRVFAQSDEVGALANLRAATDPSVPGGAYVGPAGMGGMRGRPEIVGSSAASRDRETARRLWEVSEELTGVRFELGAAA